MKCPRCESTMIVTQESDNDISQIRFHQCTVCRSEHVVSVPTALAQSPSFSPLFNPQVLTNKSLKAL